MEDEKVQVYGGKVGSARVFVCITKDGFETEVNFKDVEVTRNFPLAVDAKEYLGSTYESINNLQMDILEFVNEVTGETPNTGDLKNFYNELVYQLAHKVIQELNKKSLTVSDGLFYSGLN